MKKLLFLMLGVLMTLPAFANDFTAEYEGQTLHYFVKNEVDGTVIVGGVDKSISGDLIIPSAVSDGEREYTVVSIIGQAFKDCTGLKSVVIPNSVTEIGHYAFIGCTGLTSVDIPNSVTFIGSSAFEGCTALTSVRIPNGVSYMSRDTFSNCSNLKEVIFEDGEESLGWYAGTGGDYNNSFEGCPVEKIYMGRPGYISYSDFPYAGFFLKSLVFGEYVEKVEADFSNFKNLEYLEFSQGVKTIEANFNGTNIKWLILPESLEKISNAGTYINEGAFQDCKSLFSVMLLSRNCEIADNTFKGCGFLNKVAAYDTSLFADGGVFDRVTAKWTIEENETVDAEKGIIWGADSSVAPWVSGKYTGKLVIPEDVTVIDWSCIAECPGITEVILPAKLETIGNQVFYDCSGLQDLTIPNRVNTIGTEVFEGTSLTKCAYPDVLENPFQGLESKPEVIAYDAYDSMTEDGFVYSRRKEVLYYVPLSISSSFEVPESVCEITTHAFSKCANLESVTLPASLKALGDGVWSECNNIKSVTCMGAAPVIANRDLFTNVVYDSATLYVPDGSIADYQQAVPWSYFYNIMESSSVGINEIIPDNENECEVTEDCAVYNLSGQYVSNTTSNLTPGLYIVRQGKNARKIIIK